MVDFRVGSTVRSEAQWVGAPAEGSVRVSLRDAAADDRLVATALLRVSSPLAD